MDNAIVTATFVRLQTMADGTPRIILDVEGTLADVASFGLHPGTTFVLARLTDQAAKEDLQEKALKGGPLSIEAAGLCRNDAFQKYVSRGGYNDDEEGAKLYLYEHCSIKSRAEIDHNEYAAKTFKNIKMEFANR